MSILSTLQQKEKKRKKVTEGTTETHNLVYTCYSTNLRFNYDYTDIKIMADTSRTVWFA